MQAKPCPWRLTPPHRRRRYGGEVSHRHTAAGCAEVRFQIKVLRRWRLTKVRFGPYFEDQELGSGPTFPQNLGPIWAQIPGKIEGSNFSVDPARGSRENRRAEVWR